MAGSHRPVVDQSYQVALNFVFPSKQAQDDYQAAMKLRSTQPVTPKQ